MNIITHACELGISYDKEFEVTLDEEIFIIKLVDVVKVEENKESARDLRFQSADCFLLCYDVSNRTSYTNILLKWIPELKQVDHWPKPIILVGELKH